MRVIAGSAKSLRLKTIEGLDTRPTTDRIKETLFNMINPYINDCTFLDLFSGSGGIGIEALSRGADFAVFVEQNQGAITCIKENLTFTHLSEKGMVLKQDVMQALKSLETKYQFDILFMDPPYDKGLEEQVLLYLKDSSILHQDSIIILETSKGNSLSYVEELNFEIVKVKEYKSNKHIFLQRR